VIICLCHRISDRDIQAAARAGTPDFDTLQEDTGIARNCGCCLDCAREIFDDARCRGCVPHAAPSLAAAFAAA
jgi:bacterioferritin-associated ferredoxin